MDDIGILYYRREHTKKERVSNQQWAKPSSGLYHPTSSWRDTSMQHINNSIGMNSNKQGYPGESHSIGRNSRDQYPGRSLNIDRNPYRQVYPGGSPSIDRNPHKQAVPGESPSIDRNPSRQVHPDRSLNIDRNPSGQVHPGGYPSIDRNPHRQALPGRSYSIDKNPHGQVHPDRSLNIVSDLSGQVHPSESHSIDRNPRRQVHPGGYYSINRNPHKQALPGRSYSIDRNPRGQVHSDRSLNIDRNLSSQVHPGGSLSIDRNPRGHVNPGRPLNFDRSPREEVHPDRCRNIDRNPIRPVLPGETHSIHKNPVGRVYPGSSLNIDRNPGEKVHPSGFHSVDRNLSRKEFPERYPSIDRNPHRHTLLGGSPSIDRNPHKDAFPGGSPRINRDSSRQVDPRGSLCIAGNSSKRLSGGSFNIQGIPCRQVLPGGSPSIEKNPSGQEIAGGALKETLGHDLSKINLGKDNKLLGNFNPQSCLGPEEPITKSKWKTIKAERKKENETLATEKQTNPDEPSARNREIEDQIAKRQRTEADKKQQPALKCLETRQAFRYEEIQNPTVSPSVQGTSAIMSTVESKRKVVTTGKINPKNQIQLPPPKYPEKRQDTHEEKRQLDVAINYLSVMIRRDDGVAVDDATAADISKNLTAQVLAAVVEGACGTSMAFTAAGLVEEGYFLLRPSTEEALTWLLGCDFGISNGVTLIAKKLDSHRATIWLPNNGYNPIHCMKFIIAHNNHIKELKLSEWTLIRKDTLPQGERFLMSVPQEVATGDVWLYYQAMQIHVRIFDSRLTQPKIECECKAVCQVHAPKTTLTDKQIEGPNHCGATDIEERVDSTAHIALIQKKTSAQTQRPPSKCETDLVTQYEGLRRPAVSPSDYSVMIERVDGVALDKVAAAEINEKVADKILEALQDRKPNRNLTFTASGLVGAGFFLVRPSSEEAMTWLLEFDFGDCRGAPLRAKKLVGQVTSIWLPHSSFLPLDPLKYIKFQNTREDLKLAEWTLMRKTRLPLGERLFVSVPDDVALGDSCLDYQATQLNVCIFSYEHTQPGPGCTCVAVCPLHATRNLLGDEVYDDGNKQRRPANLANLVPVKPPRMSRKQELKIYRKRMMRKMVREARKARDRAKGRYKVRKVLSKEVQALKSKKLKEKRRIKHLNRQKFLQQRSKLRAAMKLKAKMEKMGIKE